MGLRSMIRNKETLPQSSSPLTHNSSSEDESESDYGKLIDFYQDIVLYLNYRLKKCILT